MQLRYYIAAFTPNCCAGDPVIQEPWMEARDIVADDLADGLFYNTEEEAVKAIRKHGVKGRHYIVLTTIYISVLY